MTTTAAEKKDEKVEKRRALGRGLASLLPGPRVVSPEPRVASPEGGGKGSETRIPRFARDDKGIRDDAADRDDTAVEETQVSAELAEQRRVVSIQAEAVPGNVVASLAIDLIEKNPYQTRSVFDEEQMIELRDSIKEHGVVQPVVVRPAEEEGRYILVLGERRLRASKMAGKETVPALVRRLSPQQAAEMTVLENVMREDLNPLEQAEAFRVLSKEFHLTQEQIGERVGVSRETVSNYMRLLRLPQKVMGYMLEERLSFSDARELLRLESEEHILQVAEEVVTHKLKWDEIEERVMHLNGLMVPGATQRRSRVRRGGSIRMCGRRRRIWRELWGCGFELKTGMGRERS